MTVFLYVFLRLMGGVHCPLLQLLLDTHASGACGGLPPLEIKKQKKKRSSGQILSYFLSCPPPPPEKLNSQKKGFQILGLPPPYEFLDTRLRLHCPAVCFTSSPQVWLTCSPLNSVLYLICDLSCKHYVSSLTISGQCARSSQCARDHVWIFVTFVDYLLLEIVLLDNVAVLQC